MIPHNNARSLLEKLLEKLLDHPHGLEIAPMVLEIARMLYGSHPNSQEHTGSDIQPDFQKLEDRVTTLERLHSEDEDRKDQNRGWEYEPNAYDSDGTSNADCDDREYAAQRLGSW